MTIAIQLPMLPNTYLLMQNLYSNVFIDIILIIKDLQFNSAS
jgi:hypothetical protein